MTDTAQAAARPRARRPALSGRKKLAFSLMAALVAYAGIELIAAGVLLFGYGSLSTVQARQALAARADVLGVDQAKSADILHPYLGFTRQPRADNSQFSAPMQVGEWGFNDTQTPIQKRSPHKLIVGVLGGSVAEEFANEGGRRLCAALRLNPRFSGREIVLLHLALSGYKQPQQLMAVNYLMSQGAEFDVLVNIDGFNDVALTSLENIPHGVFASYPRNWQTRVSQSSDPAVLRVIGRITFRKELSQAWASWMTGSVARFSPTMNLVWRLYDDALWRGIFRDSELAARILPQHQSYCATGPHQTFPTPDDAYRHCASVWMQSSLQLHRLAAASGICYIHFLQPNQYLPGSKELDPAERKLAYSEDQKYRVHVEQGYPWLQKFGAQLKTQGVRFDDLTRLFAEEQQATYRDDCCHYNRRGNELLADEVARVILAEPVTVHQ